MTLPPPFPSPSSTLMGFSNNINKVSSDLKEVSNTLDNNSAFERISTSCQEAWHKCPECASGYYKILGTDFTEKYVYCAFHEKCGAAGPWTRVTYLNMSDSSSVCPNGTQKFITWSDITRGIQEPSNPKCVSITNPLTHSYSVLTGAWRLKRQTNSNVITIDGQKPMLDNSIDKDQIA